MDTMITVGHQPDPSPRPEDVGAPADPRAFKPRRAHRGAETPHLGQSHFDKDQIEAARGLDQGPSFGTPGTPPGLDRDRPLGIAYAFDDLDGEKNVVRSG